MLRRGAALARPSEVRREDRLPRRIRTFLPFGREGCEIIFPDPEVSRRHALIRLLDSEIAIEDLTSTNGTWINGKRITGIQALSVGDTLKCGNTVAEVREVGAETKVSPSVDDQAS
jgi:pSer/pThr/pTyr-binding forkhead associated (FHA) protein